VNLSRKVKSTKRALRRFGTRAQRKMPFWRYHGLIGP
jgi:hypothetical protein